MHPHRNALSFTLEGALRINGHDFDLDGTYLADEVADALSLPRGEHGAILPAALGRVRIRVEPIAS